MTPSFIVAAIALPLVLLALGAATAVVRALRVGGRRDDVADRQDARAVSRFTIPGSVVVAAERLDGVGATIEALTQLNYPEFEIIVVVGGASRRRLSDGGSTDAASPFAALAREWQLDAREFFYRQSVPTCAVERIYRSGREPRLIVIDAALGSRADALNCGANVARFRYVAVVDPGVTFDPNAMLRLMSGPLRDPASVLGATSHIERTDLLGRLTSARALLSSRLFWRLRHRAVGCADAVYVWRRDALIEAKGFSTRALDPESDLVRRLVMAAATLGAPARFHRSADIFGTAAPRSVGAWLGDRARQQLVRLQLWRLLTPAGLVVFGGMGVGWLAMTSLLAPLAALWIAGVAVAAAWQGTLAWPAALGALALVACGRAIVTAAALLVRGGTPGAPDERALRRLLAAAPFEPLVEGVAACVSLPASVAATDTRRTA